MEMSGFKDNLKIVQKKLKTKFIAKFMLKFIILAISLVDIQN